MPLPETRPPSVEVPVVIAAVRVASSWRVPLLLIELSVSLPPSCTVAPFAIVMPAVEERTLLPVVANVPALTSVEPLKVLPVPERVRVPAPVFLSPPWPEILPAKVASATVVISRVAKPRSMAPVKFRSPPKVASPRVTSPPRVTSLATLRKPPPSLVKVAGPVTTSPPVATAASSPRRTVPPETVLVPPVAVLAPVTVTTPPVMDVVSSEKVVTMPPEMVELRLPATLTTPPLMPPLMRASDEKFVVPRPERLVSVMRPVRAVKFRVPSLLTAPTVRPAAEKLPVPVAAMPRVAVLLTSTAMSVAAAPIETAEVPPKAPAEAVTVPPEIVVAPVKALAPVSARLPGPVLVRLPTPLIAPEEVPELTVSVLPTAERAMVPALASVPRVSSPPRSRVAPAATVTPDVFARRLWPTVMSVPASTEVLPA